MIQKGVIIIIKEKYLRIVESTLKGVEKKETRLKLLNTTTDEEIKELFEDIAPMIDIKLILISKNLLLFIMKYQKLKKILL